MKAILVNGFPKSGTHALWKGVQLLGLPPADATDPFVPGRVSHGHYPYPAPEIPDDTIHLCIVRHPKNCLVSQVRFKGLPVASGHLIRFIRQYQDGQSMADMLRAYLPWSGRAHRVTYEDLTREDAALRTVARILGVPYLEDAFTHLPGLTLTWSGRPSNWVEHWTAAVETVWEREGLAALTTELGY